MRKSDSGSAIYKSNKWKCKLQVQSLHKRRVLKKLQHRTTLEYQGKLTAEVMRKSDSGSAIYKSKKWKCKLQVQSLHKRRVLKKLQHRTTLEYQGKLTAEVMGIDEKKEGFLTDLSVSQASERYNVLGGSTMCRCVTDCARSKSCSCRQKGNLCTTKCHKGRGSKIYCTLVHEE